MTNDTAHTYAYDAEGHVVSISTNGATTLKESYNALGWRVEAINCCGTTDYVHDAAGNMVGGSANAGPGTSTQYIYFRGGLLAQYWNGQGLWFAHLNGLGSTQQFTDYTGGHPNDTLFYPFGQPGPSGSGSGSYLQALWSGFEDGDFWATSEWQTDTRRYTPGLGRWYTPDSAGKGAVQLDDPQTWNMYAYVRNNPTTLTDPSGLDSFWTRLEHEVAGYVSTALLQGARQWTAENWNKQKKLGGYLYAKHGNGSGLGTKATLGPIKADVVLKHGEETKFTADGSTTSSVDGGGAKLGIGGFKVGLSVETTQVTMENGSPVVRPAQREVVPLFNFRKFEGSNAEVGIGIGGCVLVCGELSVGIQADRVLQDIGDSISGAVAKAISDSPDSP